MARRTGPPAWTRARGAVAALLTVFPLLGLISAASAGPAAAAPDTSGAVASIYAITQLNSIPSLEFNDAWISPSGKYALAEVYGGTPENVFYQIDGDTASIPYGLLPATFVVNFNPYNLNDLGQVGGASNGQPAVWSQGQVSTFDAGALEPGAGGSFDEISPGGVAVGTIGWTDSEDNGYGGVIESDGSGLTLECSYEVSSNDNNPDPGGSCNPDTYGAAIGVPQYLPNQRYLPDNPVPDPPTVGTCGAFQTNGANASGTIVGRTAGFSCDSIVWSAATGSELLTNLAGNSHWSLDTAWDIANDGTIIGSGTNSHGDLYMFLATPAEVPSIDSISPTEGSYLGGSNFTVTGSGFEVNPAPGYVGPGPTYANFGNTPVQLSCFNPNTYTGVTPPGSGSVDVTVSTNVGDSVGSVGFGYLGLPSVSSIAPDESPITGQLPIQIFGSGFTDATAVLFILPSGTVSVPITSGDVVNDGEIDINSPNVTGKVVSDNEQANVVVTSPEGSSPISPSDLFTFGGPDVDSVSPPIGPAGGGTTVTISGSGFTGDTNFYFGGVLAASVNSVSADGTSASVVTPNMTGQLNGNSSITVDTVAGNYGGTRRDRPPGPVHLRPAGGAIGLAQRRVHRRWHHRHHLGLRLHERHRSRVPGRVVHGRESAGRGDGTRIRIHHGDRHLHHAGHAG